MHAIIPPRGVDVAGDADGITITEPGTSVSGGYVSLDWDEFDAIVSAVGGYARTITVADAGPCTGHNCACLAPNPDCPEYQRQTEAPAIEYSRDVAIPMRTDALEERISAVRAQFKKRIAELHELDEHIALVRKMRPTAKCSDKISEAMLDFAAAALDEVEARLAEIRGG